MRSEYRWDEGSLDNDQNGDGYLYFNTKGGVGKWQYKGYRLCRKKGHANLGSDYEDVGAGLCSGAVGDEPAPCCWPECIRTAQFHPLRKQSETVVSMCLVNLCKSLRKNVFGSGPNNWIIIG